LTRSTVGCCDAFACSTSCHSRISPAESSPGARQLDDRDAGQMRALEDLGPELGRLCESGFQSRGAAHRAG
jgi:hypothetical protein